MKYIDFHADTLMRMVEDKYRNGYNNNSLFENSYHVDISRLKKSGYLAQFFACFINTGMEVFLGSSYYECALNAIDLFYKEINSEKAKKMISCATSYKEYKVNKENDVISAFLTIEEGGIIENSFDRIDELYKKGVRLITLTWNYENCLGYSNYTEEHRSKGLKPFGIEAIEKFDELGIIVDVSHLSDGGFLDVCKYSKRPFIASHSNSREICPHSRNLTDEFIRILANKGGIMGLNFYGSFLQENGKSTLEAMIKHIRHIINIGGIDVLALGSDFDGMDCYLEIKGVQDINMIAKALEMAKFKENEIEAICYKNAELFLKRYFGE